MIIPGGKWGFNRVYVACLDGPTQKEGDLEPEPGLPDWEAPAVTCLLLTPRVKGLSTPGATGGHRLLLQGSHTVLPASLCAPILPVRKQPEEVP